MSSTFAIKMPPAPTYGAVEIQKFIKKNTYRAFSITVAIFMFFLLFYWIYGIEKKQIFLTGFKAPFGTTILINISQPVNQESTVPPPLIPRIIEYATKMIAGTYVPIPDAKIKAELKDIAPWEEINQSLSRTKGQIVDLGNPPLGLDLDKKKIDVPKVEIPGEDIFIPVEKYPTTDLNELHKNIIYPETARRAGVEGKVVVRVFVSKTGQVLQSKVQYSESSMLDQAAIDAVKKCIWTPAIQNGLPIGCWVSIPVTFFIK